MSWWWPWGKNKDLADDTPVVPEKINSYTLICRLVLKDGQHTDLLYINRSIPIIDEQEEPFLIPIKLGNDIGYMDRVDGRLTGIIKIRIDQEKELGVLKIGRNFNITLPRSTIKKCDIVQVDIVTNI